MLHLSRIKYHIYQYPVMLGHKTQINEAALRAASFIWVLRKRKALYSIPKQYMGLWLRSANSQCWLSEAEAFTFSIHELVAIDCNQI